MLPIQSLLAALTAASGVPSPLPSTPIAGPAIPFGQAQAPAPPPMPMAPQKPGIDWAGAIGPLATLALAATGHNNAALGAGRGSMLADESRRREEAQQQAFQIQQEHILAQQQQQAAEVEAKRQAAVADLLMKAGPALAGAKTKADYDAGVNLYEGIGARYGIRPNSIRQAMPYRAPNSNEIMAAAADKFLKNPANKEAIEQGNLSGSIEVDVQGDGKPIAVPVIDVLKAGGVQFDPSNGKLLVQPKKASTAGVQLDDEAFLGAVAKFEADKGRPATQAERGDIANKVIETIANKRRTPAVVVQAGGPGGNSPVDRAAQAVVDGRMAPSQAATMFGGMGKEAGAFKRAMTDRVMELKPDFNFQEAESNYQFGKNTGTQNTVRYIDSIAESMPLLIQRANALKNGNFRSLNALINQGKNQVNDVPLKQFQTDVTLVADEVAKILQGGGTGSGTSDAKLRQASGILNSSDSPQAIAAALADINTLIGNRKRTLTRGTYMDENKPSSGGPVAGSIVTLKDGRKVKVDKVNADGTFAYTVVR